MEPDEQPTLVERLAAEVRPARSLQRAEEMIVKGLKQYGFGEQTQVTAADSFEIAVDDLIITVELNPDAAEHIPSMVTLCKGKHPWKDDEQG